MNIILPFLLLVAVAGEVCAREGATPAQATARDATAGQRKAIEEKFAAQIAKARKQIRGLTAEVAQLDRSINGLKRSSAQLLDDYNAWASNAQRASGGKKDSLAAQAKQKELQGKLDGNNKKIAQYQQEKKAKQQLVKELEKTIAGLEKEKDAALKKLK
jgi:chromosome segregation ATPase